MGRTVVVVFCFCVLLGVAGCKRTHYRLRADRDAYGILSEKSARGPWYLHDGYSVYPDPRSRFHNPSPQDDPALPVPAPQLYAYRLPELPERDPARFRSGTSDFQALSESVAAAGSSASPEVPARATAAADRSWPPVHVTSYQTAPPPAQPQPLQNDIDPQGSDPEEEPTEMRIAPIPADTWQSLPPKCLVRMFEFGSVRSEYERTFGAEPSEDQRDQSQRLALEDIVELAQINSREYQTEKEALYDTALTLSLERFQYDLKFATGGNRTAANYVHNRSAGITTNTLGIPTTITSDRLLATGTDLLARFANDVVLTFNGPQGFAADIGSELFFDLSHSVFQRDIRFEALTQAERRVVYAARDYARFRKILFADLAARYYNLLLTYRGIEIATQDYFSNLRGFKQAEAEHIYRGLPRFQVDQFEQRALSSRRGLISACNQLEEALDRLKLDVGLPPELPLNLNLVELEELTLRDEVTATAERVQRAQRRLATVRARPAPQRGELLNDAIRLVDELLSLQQLRQERGEDVSGIDLLRTRLAKLKAEQVRMQVEFKREVLLEQRDAETPPPELLLISRTMDLIGSLLELTERELVVAEQTGVDAATVRRIRLDLQKLVDRYDELQEDIEPQKPERESEGAGAIPVADDEKPAEKILERIPEFTRRSDTLLTDAEGVALEAQSLLPSTAAEPEDKLAETKRQVDELIAQSRQFLAGDIGGLVPIEIDADDAMLTALTLRYDAMTQREQMADQWRQVKLAADDLKSVLNLNASQSIRTRSGVNRPFDFTFDDSTTRLSMTLDAPLNRRAQRNGYRRQLIDYNQAFRNLIALEDSIKFSIRSDLRDLSLQREQYRIAVTSTALAYDRVVSTRLQFRLGTENIRAQDVLEAQQDYTRSLVELATAHIQYIQRRLSLFLELELLTVDQDGFWPGLYEEAQQPTPNYQLPEYCQPVYGELPPGLWYSKQIKRMLHVPAGQSVIFHPSGSREEGPEEIPAPAPSPAAGEEGRSGTLLDPAPD